MSKPTDEKSVMLIFEGWQIDAFITESGSLGLTVEQLSDSAEPAGFPSTIPSRDIFVQPGSLEVNVA
jgi:hypothetical protein